MSLDLLVVREAAEKAAGDAASLINDFQRQGNWSVSLKSDASPVTEVDVASEKCIKAILTAAIPEAGFYGEETGISKSTAATSQSIRWLVDPIDGTKSFIRGMRYFSTQIAFEMDGVLCVGVSNAPAYGERLVAVKEQGVWLNQKSVRCSDVTTLADAFLSSGNLGTLARDTGAWSRYGKLVNSVRRVRGYGDFCHYHQLCCGQTDLIVESDVNILDIAALVVGIREAGGIITDLTGAAVDENTTSVLAACSEELHQEALSLIDFDKANVTRLSNS